MPSFSASGLPTKPAKELFLSARLLLLTNGSIWRVSSGATKIEVAILIRKAFKIFHQWNSAGIHLTEPLVAIFGDLIVAPIPDGFGDKY